MKKITALLSNLFALASAASLYAAIPVPTGVFYFPSQGSLDDVALENSNVDGVVIGATWVELQPNTATEFDFKTLDDEIATVESYGKPMRLAILTGGPGARGTGMPILGTTDFGNKPAWLINQLVAEKANFFTYYSGYDQGIPTTKAAIPAFWEPTLLNAHKALVAAVAAHIHAGPHPLIRIAFVPYANANTNDWNLGSTSAKVENPDPVRGVSSPQGRWVAALKSQNGATNVYDYHSDMGAALIYTGEQTYDAYATNFADEILTTSIGRLQNTILNPNDTTGNGTNIVNTVTLYAANNYAQGDKINRIVVQKNNLNGGNVLDAPGGTSAWHDLYVLSQPPYNRPTAAQMVWHAYGDCDTYGAERMDAGTGSACLDSTIMLYQAVDHGVTYGTKWQELYELDILHLGDSNGDTDVHIDPAKHDAIAYAHAQLYHPSPVVLTRMVSRLMHGGAGSYDINLTAGNVVECRTPSAGVFTFTDNITSVGGATLNGSPRAASHSGRMRNSAR